MSTKAKQINTKRALFTFALFLVFSLIGPELLAQPGSGPGQGPGCWPPPCTVPVDGGIGFLIAAGIAYGGKKLYDKKGM